MAEERNGETVIAWEAPSHVHMPRSVDWYWALGIVALCGAVASVLWGNLLFALIIVLAAGSLGVAVARGPRHCEVHVGPRGISVDRDFYPYQSIRSFWIDIEYATEPKLYFATTGLVHPHITLIVRPPAEPGELRSYLTQYIPEEVKHSVGTIFAEFLGL